MRAPSMTAAPGWPMVEAVCLSLLSTSFTMADRLTKTPGSAVYRVALPTGHEHASVIIKLYTGPSRWKAAREHQVVMHLSGEEQFGVPSVLGSGQVPGADAVALVLEDLGTTTLHKAVDEGVLSHPKALSEIGRLLACFHRVPRQPNSEPRLAAQIADLSRRVPDDLGRRTRVRLDRIAALSEGRRGVWCHGDLHMDNVLLRPGPYLIDFEHVGDNLAEWDLAQTAVTADATARADRAPLLAGYRDEVCEELLSGLVLFQTLRGWWWAAVHEKRDVRLWESRLALALDPSIPT